jgi:hypothetical protein
MLDLTAVTRFGAGLLALALAGLTSSPVWAGPPEGGGCSGPQIEAEPNDTAATASPIDLPDFTFGMFTGIGGAVAAAGDVDWYSFTAPAGTRLWLSVDTGVAMSGSRDSLVTLLAADGTTVIEADDDDGTGNARDFTIESQEASLIAGRLLSAGGTYFARVQAKVPAETIEAYSLLIAVSFGGPSPEMEPNDVPPGQLPFVVPILGSLSSANDVDWYNLTILDFGFPFLLVDGDPERDGTGTNVTVHFEDFAIPPSTITTDSSGAGSPSDPPAEGFAIESLGFARVTGTAAGTYMLGVWYTGKGCPVPVELQAFEIE